MRFPRVNAALFNNREDPHSPDVVHYSTADESLVKTIASLRLLFIREVPT